MATQHAWNTLVLFYTIQLTNLCSVSTSSTDVILISSGHQSVNSLSSPISTATSSPGTSLQSSTSGRELTHKPIKKHVKSNPPYTLPLVKINNPYTMTFMIRSKNPTNIRAYNSGQNSCFTEPKCGSRASQVAVHSSVPRISLRGGTKALKKFRPNQKCFRSIPVFVRFHKVRISSVIIG